MHWAVQHHLGVEIGHVNVCWRECMLACNSFKLDAVADGIVGLKYKNRYWIMFRCVQGVVTNQDSVKTAAGNGLAVSAGVIFRLPQAPDWLTVRDSKKMMTGPAKRTTSHETVSIRILSKALRILHASAGPLANCRSVPHIKRLNGARILVVYPATGSNRCAV